MKLFFCLNDFPIRGEFWQNNSFITHILFELCRDPAMPILIFSPVQIIITHPLVKHFPDFPLWKYRIATFS